MFVQIAASAAFLYCAYYAKYRAHTVAFDAMFIIPLLIFVIGAPFHIISIILSWDFRLVVLLAYIVGYLIAFHIITNIVTEDQKMFINDEGPLAIVLSIFATLLYIAFVHDFAYILNIIYFILFLYFYDYISGESNITSDKIGAAFLAAIGTLICYTLKNLAQKLSTFAMNYFITNIVHSTYGITCVTCISVVVYAIRVHLLESRDTLIFNIGISFLAGIFYYCISLLIFQLVNYY